MGGETHELTVGRFTLLFISGTQGNFSQAPAVNGFAAFRSGRKERK